MDEITAINHKCKKPGIIYLSTIPDYMNVTRIREVFSEYGEVCRVFLQLSDLTKAKKVSKKFSEGWVEFEKKSVAKKVAIRLNNQQVNTRKKSKNYDCIWNIKYLSGFKWIHLHERLAYEKAIRRQKIRAEISLAKKKTNYFTTNLRKHKNEASTHLKLPINELKQPSDEVQVECDRQYFLKSIFN